MPIDSKRCADAFPLTYEKDLLYLTLADYGTKRKSSYSSATLDTSHTTAVVLVAFEVPARPQASGQPGPGSPAGG